MLEYPKGIFGASLAFKIVLKKQFKFLRVWLRCFNVPFGERFLSTSYNRKCEGGKVRANFKKEAYGTTDIAKICHVMPSTVGRWLDEKRIPSYKTGGGHRRVWTKDLVRFLKDHNIPLPTELMDQGKAKILIVDDEAPVRRLVRRWVQKFFPGVHVYEAADGFEAGHQVSALRPDLVILDLRLPGIHGLKVCQVIRADKNLEGVKILAMTGYDIEEARPQALGAGADEFLSKPINSVELFEKIGRLLSLNVKS